jgi:hypothetical protein
MEGQ